MSVGLADPIHGPTDRVAPPDRREAGQATVEFALCLPVLAMALLLIVQTALIVRARILVVEAAREGARAAARASSPADAAPAARAAAARTAGLRPGRLQVETTATEPDAVTVTVSYDMPTDVPLVGALLPDPVLRAEVTMRREDLHPIEPP